MTTLRLDGPALLFGGPYSNLQATRAVLAEAARLGIPPRRVVCTGDVVAYCADAAATLDLVIGSGIAVVQGNCEQSLAESAGDCGCGFEEGTDCAIASRGWFAYADGVVTAEHRRWMGALPRRIVVEAGRRRLAVLHGGAEVVNRFVFASAPDAELRQEIESTGCDGVVAGHCGLPFTRLVDGLLWHNPGVIGMPADDGTPRTWFSVLTADKVAHRALEYDWRAAAAAMDAAGLAPGYRAALASGTWPSGDVLPPAERAARGRRLSGHTVRW